MIALGWASRAELRRPIVLLSSIDFLTMRSSSVCAPWRCPVSLRYRRPKNLAVSNYPRSGAYSNAASEVPVLDNYPARASSVRDRDDSIYRKPRDHSWQPADTNNALACLASESTHGDVSLGKPKGTANHDLDPRVRRAVPSKVVVAVSETYFPAADRGEVAFGAEISGGVRSASNKRLISLPWRASGSFGSA